ncbi:ABC transporter substrate-binding protein [Rhodoplanes roseus]|uniref:Sulfonate/nitrate transporter n=1 Tax=Rhodoplanes roseus TaxID=29409 RepID=A0A327KX01_9BRAD|nr:ABC transporter substrate-binding protein [Rhodoplanes roseus]RAI43440.1 sulfonate/nitrate transporter [Rhodoplanes roseus]
MTGTLSRITTLALALMLIGAPAQAAEKITFMIDWLPAGDKAVPYLAVKKGLFAAEGLDVTIQSGRGSSDVVTKLGTGAADIGTGGLAALLQAKAETGVPVKAVYSIYTKQADAIFTTEGSGITSLKDVAGKKVATATFSSSNVSWPLVLTANGIDPASVQLLKVDPGALAPMLAAGQIVATINWITVAAAFEGPLAEAKKTLKVLQWSDYGYDGYGLSLFVSERMLKERPATVKKFVKAYAEATRMAIADPKAAADALKAMVPEIDVATAEKQFVSSIPLIVNDISKRDGDGAFEPKLLATTWQWVAKAQNLPIGKLDPETVVDRSVAK